MDAAAFQFAQLRIAAHSSHKLIEHLKESPAQQQDKKDNGGIQQWRKGMRLKGDMELNRDTQGNDIDQRSLRDHRQGKSAEPDDADLYAQHHRWRRRIRSITRCYKQAHPATGQTKSEQKDRMEKT